MSKLNEQNEVEAVLETPVGVSDDVVEIAAKAAFRVELARLYASDDEKIALNAGDFNKALLKALRAASDKGADGNQVVVTFVALVSEWKDGATATKQMIRDSKKKV